MVLFKRAYMRANHLWGSEELGGKIVCNELRRMHLISFSDWVHDARYCKEHISPVVYRGYRVWAIPCLKLMRRHSGVARGIAIPARWFIEDIKFEQGARKRRHWRGKLLRCALFTPGSWLLGVGVGVLSVIASRTTGPVAIQADVIPLGHQLASNSGEMK